MPKPVAEVAEGHEDASGSGVYCFIRDLIVEGRDARFVDKKGRYVINWSRALKCYHVYKSRRNPQYKSKNINRRKASNGLRAALLNFYKKEGAKEYKDCKKVNEKDEVVERQFQMPPRVFESLFGSNAQLSDYSSEPETTCSSIASEADEKPLATPNSSDTGFDEAMDVCDEPSSEFALDGLPIEDPLWDNVKTEEGQVDPSDIATPCQIFDINFSEEELDSALGEICSNSDNDVDLLGVVRDICPSSGSVKGGLQFYISLTEELSEDDQSGIAHFDGIGDVFLEKLNCYTLAGILPASQQPGPVPVTVNTQDGRLLGMTCFLYVDEIQEVLKQLVNDPALQSLYFAMWSKQHGSFGSDANLAQDLGPFTLQDQGSANQGTHAQALKVLQLLVYTAAQTNAQQFIQMIFSTSAGKLVFNAYKNRPQLPEDVARANGHDNLAQYLQDVNARLSKENINDAQPNAIDWLELIEAVNKVQKQSSVILDETDLESGQSKDDDSRSDYFADAETSSCGSFELEMEWSGSEDGEGPFSKDERPKKKPDERLTPSMEVTSKTITALGTILGNKVDQKDDGKSDTITVSGPPVVGKFSCLPKVAASGREEEARTVPTLGKTTKPKRTRKKRRWLEGDDVTIPTHQWDETQKVRSFVEGIFQGSNGGGTQKIGNIHDRKQEKRTGPSRAERHNQRNQWRPFRSALLKSFLLLTIAAMTVLCLVAGIKLAERQLLHWAVRNGHIRISHALLKFVSDVDTPNFHGETSLHVAAENGYKDLAELLMKLGSNVNAKSHQKHTPLHLAAWSGCQEITDALIRHGSDVNARDDSQWTALHLAADLVQVYVQRGSDVNAENRLGWTPLHVAAFFGEVLVQHGSGINIRDSLGCTPLHFAAWNGHLEIAELLIHHGSNVNAGNTFGETPLHLAAYNGRRNVAEVLIRYGSDANVRNKFGETPLHLAAMKGHLQMVQFLIQRGSDVEARDDDFQLSALHVAAIYGHKQITELLIHHGSDVNAGNKFGETPLHLAAYNGRRNIVEVLIQTGSDVNARDIFGETPLLEASRGGDQEITEFLIQHGSEPKTQDDSQQTPLHLAARSGHRNVAEVLIRYGSDVNVRNKFGETPLHLAAMEGHLQMVQFLIQRGSDVEARDDDFQLSALHVAAIYGHKQITELLIHHGSNVNAGNKFGETPLHIAAYSRRNNIVEVLIQNGSDVNARDIFGETPLLEASRGGDQNITEFLIQHGSEPKTQDDSQQTPLHLAARNGHRNVAEVLLRYGSDVNVRNTFGETPLHLAVRFGHKQIVEMFLHHGSDVNARDGFLQTPIHLAARNGHKNITEALIRHGCDVNVKDTFLQTPLHLATRSGRREIVEFLTLLGSGLEAQNGFKQTALHLVTQNGHKNFARINVGNNVFLCDVILQYDLNQICASPTLSMLYTSRMAYSLNLAVRNGHKNVTEVFIGCGSDVNFRNLHLAAWSGHQELTEFISRHESKAQAIDDLLLNTDVNFRNNRVQWPASSNAEKMFNITDNLREFHPRDVPVISPNVLFKLLQSGKSLETLLNFAQTIWETPSCLGPVNLSIGLGNDDSGPRDHKLKLDKPSITQCLSRSLGGGDGISHNMDPGLDIKYQGRCEIAFKTKRKNLHSLALPCYVLCSTKLATSGNPKDKHGGEVLIKHSFRFVDKSIKNGSELLKRSGSKMLKRSEIPLKEIAYEGLIHVNAMVLLLLITLITLYIVLRKGLWYRNGNSGATASETNGSQKKTNHGSQDEVAMTPFV